MSPSDEEFKTIPFRNLNKKETENSYQQNAAMNVKLVKYSKQQDDNKASPEEA